MTELVFLLDLLLNHKLSKGTKDLIKARIGEVEQNMTRGPAQKPLQSIQFQGVPNGATDIAETALAAKALLERNQAISQATSGKMEQGRTSPRKF